MFSLKFAKFLFRRFIRLSFLGVFELCYVLYLIVAYVFLFVLEDLWCKYDDVFSKILSSEEVS